jgi:hypothetical protein
MQPAKSAFEYVAQLFWIPITQLGIKTNFLDSLCDIFGSEFAIVIAQMRLKSNEFLLKAFLEITMSATCLSLPWS